MFPEVWERVVRGRYRSTMADLDAHARLTIVGEAYPGLIGRSGCRVRGVVYFGVRPEDVARLDDFEGQEYRRVPIAVAVANVSVPAETYLFVAPSRLSEQDWQPELFQKQSFLDAYCGDDAGNEKPENK